MSLSPIEATPPDKSTEVVEDRYSSFFPLYDDANIVVRSSDGMLFATEKLYLQAASAVFYDVLRMGSEAAGEKRDGRALLQLSEKGEDLEPFLRLVQRDRFQSENVELGITMTLLLKLSPLVEKYGATSLAAFLYDQSLSFLASLPANKMGGRVVNLFALAVVHGREEAARRALRRLGDVGASETGSSAKGYTDWRPQGIEDLSTDLVTRMPAEVIIQFSTFHRKDLTRTDFSWLKAADEFKPSSEQGFIFPLRLDLDLDLCPSLLVGPSSSLSLSTSQLSQLDPSTRFLYISFLDTNQALVFRIGRNQTLPSSAVVFKST